MMMFVELQGFRISGLFGFAEVLLRFLLRVLQWL